jgi:MFS family permease
MRFRGPLSNSYPAAVLLVLFALVPYLALTSALTPLEPVLSKSLGLSQQALQLTNGMANAAYAFGTVLAVQFAVRFPQRRMLLVYSALFLLSSVMTALAFTPGFFIAGHVLQGLFTSLMLIAAVPPLVTGWSASKMPWTAGVMNMCIFGAVALGPVIGGVQAGAGDWRPLFWLVSGSAALAVLFALLTFEDQPPADRSAPWDVVAVLLAGFGSAAAFFGASELTTHAMLSVIVFVPLLAGVAAIATLVVHQYLATRSLMPVRQLASTKPVAGIITAMCAAAASVAAVSLAELALKTTTSPVHGAMLFWPEFGGAVVSAIAFALLLRTRWLSAGAFTGIGLLAGGVAIMTGVATGPHVLVVVGSGLIGIGVGAAVAPALFIAGFTVVSSQLQRVIAMIELLRAVAAFLAAPILLHLAMTVNGGPKGAGINTGMWVCLAIAAGGGFVSVYLFVLGRARPQRPDIERWQEGEGPAWDSPPLAAGIRGGRTVPGPARSVTG